MESVIHLQLFWLLWTCMITVGSGASVQQVPLLSTTTGDDMVVSSLKSVFSSLTTAFPPRPTTGGSQGHFPRSGFALCTWGDSSTIQGCQGDDFQRGHNITATLVNTVLPTSVSITTDSSIIHHSPSPSASMAKLLQTRTTIFWSQPTATKRPAKDGDEGQHPSQHETPEELTNDFYTFSMSGHNPSAITLILQNGSGDPVTLLSLANTATYSNLISSALVDQLNLTRRIVPPSRQGKESSDENFTPILSEPSTVVGTLTLDYIIVGRHDRPIQDVGFIVFQFDKAPKVWLPDVVMGLEFLTDVGALQLSPEFLGVGAKEGVGIVVQPIIAGNAAVPVVGDAAPIHEESLEHDEL